MTTYTPQLAKEYQQLFDSCLIKENKYAEIDSVLTKVLAGKPQYESIAATIKVPWYFTGIIHTMECGSKFTTHLHNGDPLSARTVQVPRGYPKTGTPPFTWETSAIDALKLKGLDKWTDWSLPAILFQFERYNGFGYRPKGINSPYLWSYSNHYSKGKYIADGVFDDKAISKQCGTAVLLRRLSERQLAVIGELDTVSQIKLLGSKVSYAPNTYNANAEQLQRLLNRIGLTLRIDGKAGSNTSKAYFSVSGNYLKGDPNK
jgi:lysozyme family protein